MEAPLCCGQKYRQNAELWNSMFEILGSIYVKLTQKEHPAHFALPGCAVTSDLSDLQLNKGTGNKAQGRRGFSTKIEELFQVDRDNC
jgi:hypothetical protein